MGRRLAPRADWDAATRARPEDIVERFRRTVPVGIEHGTVGVIGRDGVLYEVTTFRRDVETFGRHARVTFADTVDEDLSRRDFTINAIAWRPRTDDIRDPFGGVDDLHAGMLRAVGLAEERFAEDYLRVLRALRFAGRFDLEIEPATRAALEEAVPGLPGLSAERVREELMKVLADPVPSTALDLYAAVGALDVWYPELGAVSRDRIAWTANLAAVDEVRPHRPRVRLARWLIPIGGDPETRRHRADALCDRLRFSTRDRRYVADLAAGFLPFVGPLDSDAQIRSWLAEVGDRWRDLFRLHIAGARAEDSEDARGYLLATWRQVHRVVAEHPPLRIGDLAVSGDDLLELGLARGPLVGLMLEELFEQVLEDPSRNDRETLVAEAARLIELGGLARVGRSGGGADDESGASP